MMPDAYPARGERVFRALLGLYPRQFRDRFGEEMVEFYRERRRELVLRQGGWGAARLWLHLVVDVSLSAPVERWRAATTETSDRISWASSDYPQETHPMETLRQDLRYAVRTLARHPGFALISALTLALGIGANTAIFSVVDAVLLRPLPWPDASQLVTLSSTRGGQVGGVVYLDYKDWREQSSSFDALGVFRGQSVNLTGVETPERLTGSFVNADFLRMLGAGASQGRLFTPAETEVATRVPSAVLSDALWRTRFGARPDILGQRLIINGESFTVVGVLRPDFQSPLFTPDVFLPLGYYPNRGDLEVRGRPGIAVIGKLRSGVTPQRAQEELDAIAARIAELYPASNAGVGVSVQSLRDQLVGPSRAPLAIVLASVGIVLLIACANVANLQLARATARRRELSVRAALGAGRRRIMRQLLTESLLLSVLGGVAGLGIAYAGVRWLSAVIPSVLTVYGPVALSRGVLEFAALVTIATGILFGVAPAWRASRTQMQEALTTRGAGAGVRLRTHQWLVVAQIALCVVLLVTAGLLTRSLMALAGVQPGFDPAGVLTLQFRLPNTKYDSEAKIAEAFGRMITEIRAVPGVDHAAIVRATPLNGNGDMFPYLAEGTAETERARLPQANRNLVSPDYFETMRLPRIAGRDFTDADRLGGMPVAIVNQQVARKLDPTGNALGKRVQVMDGDAPVWATVVGVVGNAKHFQVNEPQLDQIYMPYTQKPLIFTEVVVRSTGDPAAIGNAVRAAIWRVDHDQPVWRIRALRLSIDNQLGSRKFMMVLLASFAVLAVVLALIGIYGVMSYGVARRMQEMGIRMALGAQRAQVVGLVLRQGARTIGAALALGVLASLAATRALQSQLFGVGATDPITFAVVPVALGAVALVACYLPARRASRADPVRALRAD